VTDLSIVLPAYNEADNIKAMIGDVVETFNGIADTYEVIVVDDGSRDGTDQVVTSLEARHPELRLVQHAENKGYGAAVFSGLTAATKDLVFFTDADRQFDLSEIENLLSLMSDTDLVVGYRAPRRDPFMRKLNGWGWSILVTLLFGYTARDIDCAFKLMRRDVIEELRNQIQSWGATFSAEFLVRARRAGFRIREIPIRGHRPRIAGSPTGARPDVILRAFGELVRFRFQLWREKPTQGNKN
jgi:glycosyltransferase involved in cell wall biosynthesis